MKNERLFGAFAAEPGRWWVVWSLACGDFAADEVIGWAIGGGMVATHDRSTGLRIVHGMPVVRPRQATGDRDLGIIEGVDGTWGGMVGVFAGTEEEAIEAGKAHAARMKA